MRRNVMNITLAKMIMKVARSEEEVRGSEPPFYADIYMTKKKGRTMRIKFLMYGEAEKRVALKYKELVEKLALPNVEVKIKDSTVWVDTINLLIFVRDFKRK